MIVPLLWLMLIFGLSAIILSGILFILQIRNGSRKQYDSLITSEPVTIQDKPSLTYQVTTCLLLFENEPVEDQTEVSFVLPTHDWSEFEKSECWKRVVESLERLKSR